MWDATQRLRDAQAAWAAKQPKHHERPGRIPAADLIGREGVPTKRGAK